MRLLTLMLMTAAVSLSAQCRAAGRGTAEESRAGQTPTPSRPAEQAGAFNEKLFANARGDRDELVDVAESRRMIEAIRRAGGRPRYTEYKGVGHNSWERAFAEPDLLPWMFAQTR